MGRNHSGSRLTKLEKSWILYDVGNSAFTMLACSLIPIWFKTLAVGTNPGQISSDRATAYWALLTSAVTIVTAVLGPVLGTFMDYEGRKKKFFTVPLLIGVAGCIAAGFSLTWGMFLILYAVSRTAYSITLPVY